MRSRPAVVAFDVIETLFSLEKLRERLLELGLPGSALEVWFAQILRDAFALEVTGVYRPFRVVASAALTSLLVRQGIVTSPEDIGSVLDTFATLDAQPDASTAFRRLHDEGIRVVTLTNGSAEATLGLLQRVGLERWVERTISIEEVGHWKPHREVYLHAARCMGIEPQRFALVAAHAWDVHGAGSAGLTTAYVDRGSPYPAFMSPAHLVGPSLAAVAEALVRMPAERA